MPFARLDTLLPELARTETRSVIVAASAERPVEQFLFDEMYCNEQGCDCRRVVFQVMSTSDPGMILATISYGWEPDSYYRRWARFPLSAEDLDELRGPGLLRFNPQSERAEEMLDHCRLLLKDDRYRGRLVRHYLAVRELIDVRSAKPARWRSTSRKKSKASSRG